MNPLKFNKQLQDIADNIASVDYTPRDGFRCLFRSHERPGFTHLRHIVHNYSIDDTLVKVAEAIERGIAWC